MTKPYHHRLDKESTVDRLMEKTKQLKKDLAFYGRHIIGCPKRSGDLRRRCNCGFSKALKEINGKDS